MVLVTAGGRLNLWRDVEERLPDTLVCEKMILVQEVSFYYLLLNNFFNFQNQYSENERFLKFKHKRKTFSAFTFLSPYCAVCKCLSSCRVCSASAGRGCGSCRPLQSAAYPAPGLFSSPGGCVRISRSTFADLRSFLHTPARAAELQTRLL